MVAAVAVAVQLPPETSDEAAARVVESCQAALGPDQCALATGDRRAKWRAIVDWQGMRLVVTLEHTQTRGTPVARREITFSPSDSEEQRWVAAGLMVAAVTAAQSEPEGPQQPPEEPQTREEPAALAEPHPAPATLRGVVDFGGLVGQGLRSSEPKLGILGRGWLMLNAASLGATASLRFASSFGNPELRWYGGSAGVAARVTDWSAPFGLELVAELLLEQAQARATRDGVEQVLTSSWRGGAQLGAVASYSLARWFVPWVAADVSALRPELEVRIADRTVGTEGDVRWAFSLGARFQWSDSRDESRATETGFRSAD
jgi:hypothetical protein